jgi:GT2 family glycosyltransferase
MRRPSGGWPICVREVDIARPLRPIEGIGRYSRVRVFVKQESVLIGAVDIWHHGAPAISVLRLKDEIANRLAPALYRADLVRRLRSSEASSRALPASRVSIVVPACDREQDLRRCLGSLIRQRTRHAIEIIVVDNRPSCGIARRVAAEFPSVRLLTEERPGLSYARNHGISRAGGSFIVATDDDVEAPEDWIETLLEPFSRPDVQAVTGQVLPKELETEAQCLFEAYGGLGKGFTQGEVDAEWFRARRTAVPTWELGATANAAFRASIFSDERIGLMDEALGAGMPTGCSEDTYLFYRILGAGGTIVYLPSAYVWHRHRRSMRELRSQIYAYSKGHVAYHLTTWLRDGDRRALVRLGYSLPKAYGRRALQRLTARSDYPLSLLAVEILGNLAGPLALWRARRRVRSLGAGVRPVAERNDAVSLEGRAT